MTCQQPFYWRSKLNASKTIPLAEASLRIDVPGPVYAVQIGPESDFDRCWIVPGGQLQAPSKPPATGIIWTDPSPRNGIKVSVESPYVGFLPLSAYQVLLPYARGVQLIGSTATRMHGLKSDDTDWLFGNGAGISDANPKGQQPQLELIFHRMPIPWLPVKRPPIEWVYQRNTFDGVASAQQFHLPGWGRKSCSLSLELGDYSAGTLRWSFRGINVAGDIFFIEDLQAETDETAGFDRTYHFDGEFDLYQLNLTEQSALNAGADVRAIWKAWD